MSTTCRNCGLSLNANDAFCANCGQAAAAATAGVQDGREADWPTAAASGVPPYARAAGNDAEIGPAETAQSSHAFSGKGHPVSEHGFGQGRADDAGRAAYEAQGQPRSKPGRGRDAGSPVQATAAYPAPSEDRASSKGFVASLFDFGFTSFVTPTVVKVLYVLIMIVLALTGLGFAVSAFTLNKIAGIFVLIVVAPLFFFVFLALYRIVLELFIVIFRIAEDLRAIRDRGGFR
jgi:Domain of unknown function (DUF4282)